MHPEPAVYMECPLCNKILMYSDWSPTPFDSAWGFNWSDGKRDGNFNHIRSALGKCPQCKELFRLRDAREVSKPDDFPRAENIEMVREMIKTLYIKKPSIEDYQTSLAGIGAWRFGEHDLRFNLWWALNDFVRYEDKKPELFLMHEKVFKNNLESLLNLLKKDYFLRTEDLFIEAEIARELGDFDACLLRLDVIPKKYKKYFMEEEEAACNKIRQFCQQGIRLVQPLSSSL